MMRNRIAPFMVVGAALIVAAGCKGKPSGAVEVKIAITESTPALKAATIVVDYQRSGATIETKGGAPACVSILPHVVCRFRDDGNRLTIDAESAQGFSGPADLAVCRMVPVGAADSTESIRAGLRVTLLDPRGTDGQPVAVASASSRGSSGGPSAAASDTGGAYEGSEPGRVAKPAGRAATGGAATGAAPGSGSGTGTGQGMVVTRDDLQRRDRERAEQELARRRSEGGTAASQGTGSAADSSNASSSAGDGSADEIPAEEPGTGKNDPTDDDASATEYGVRFDLASSSGPIGALQFDVDYHGGSGGWLGAGGGADCRWLLQAALHACNDKRGGSLTCALVDTNGFSGPSALMECSFKSRNSVAAGDFAVRVTDASDPGLNPTDARVIVSSVYAR